MNYTLKVVAKNKSELARHLEKINDMIKEGYTSGLYPTIWDLEE